MKIKTITHRNQGIGTRESHRVIDFDLDSEVLVVKWNWLTFDEPTPLLRASSLLAGDTVWTLHKGKATITEVLHGFWRFDGEEELFAVQPHEGFPLVARGAHTDATVVYDWRNKFDWRK